MAVIIDLDFYRKFRVALPVRPSTISQKNSSVARVVAKRYRRRKKFVPLQLTSKESREG